MALRGVQAARTEAPAVPSVPGQLVVQLDPQQLVGRVRDAHTPRDPSVHRARRHLKKLRDVGHRKPEPGVHGFEPEGLFHAGFRAAGPLARWWFDVPRCILCKVHDLKSSALFPA